jgi:hypothetical protein
LKAKQSAMEGFGTLMQEFSAGHYAGKRVRLSASVKADEVKSGSVWLNSVKFESVGLDVPTTAKAPARLPEGPANLKFENYSNQCARLSHRPLSNSHVVVS